MKTTPLRRTAFRPVVRLPKPRLKVRMRTLDPMLRALVLERSRGRCECCGDPLHGRVEVHHRKLRSQGGPDAAENLLVLRASHHAHAHGQPTYSYDRGLLVHCADDPATAPLLLHGRRRVLLTTDGRYEEAS